MMSLYAEYIQERTDDRIIEIPEGFATYRYPADKQVYLVDIYVRPEYRKLGFASALADRVIAEAVEEGCNEFIGTVNPSSHGATASLKVLLAYGMELMSCHENVIVLRKAI